MLGRRSSSMRLGGRMWRARRGMSRRSRNRRHDRRSRVYDGSRMARRSTVVDRSAVGGRRRRFLLRRRLFRRWIRSRSHVRDRVGDRYRIRRRLRRRGRARRRVTRRARYEHHERQDDHEPEHDLRVSCTHPRWMSARDGQCGSRPPNLVPRPRRHDRSNAGGRLSVRLVSRMLVVRVTPSFPRGAAAGASSTRTLSMHIAGSTARRAGD